MACPFCDIDTARVFARNRIAFALRDSFPVNPGHSLVIPQRHFDSWFSASKEERSALIELVDDVKARLDDELHPDGYNIGMNVGKAAGQTVMHLHIHVIPRFAGDVDDPAGGVRFVIPARGNYRRLGHIPEAKE
jgi:diadenosine tetraphosphate (Ap4A) HIT family hydrolase